MRKHLLFCWLTCMGMCVNAAERKITSPDGKLVVVVSDSDGKATYSVAYDDELFIASSPLGMKTNIGDFTTGLFMGEGFKTANVESEYSLPNIKKSNVEYSACKAVVPFMKDGKTVFDVEFSVSNNDVAFRYTVYPDGNTLCCVVEDEVTGFTMPEGTTTFLCPQSGPMGGFARTSPSYETPYTLDAATGSNGWGEGYTFPCLFRNSDKGWILVSKTGVDSYYCASHFVRNTVGSMDFGGSTLNRYYNAANEPRGSRRVTSDVFALATAVLFQSPVQHFAIAPNNLTDAPVWAVDFMKKVPTTWDDVKFIDGYPGKYVVMARKHGDKWIISGVNAQDKTLKLNLNLSAFFNAGETVTLYSDDAKLNGTASEIKINKKQELKISIPKNGGLVITK